MNIKRKLNSSTIFILATFFTTILPETQPSIIEPVPEEKPAIKNESAATSAEPKAVEESTEPKKIVIRFEDENLVDVIDFIAKQKGANIILPVGEKSITSKITIRLPDKFTVDEAWSFLYTLIEMAGYSMVPRGDNSFAILKITNPAQEPLRLYIGVNYDDLPDTDEPIRALFYFSNIKLSTSEEATNTFNALLTQLMPPEMRNGSGNPVPKFAIDPLANALIISDRARNIKAVMRIVSHLERTEFKEKYEVISLMYTTADEVAKLFNETILKEVERYPMGAPRKPIESAYFSRNVKIVPEGRLNVLLVFGREQAVDRIVDFIRAYIDVPPESGKSILHIYKLRYLDAAEFKPVLEQIVAYDSEGQTGQARVTAGQPSVERYFEGPPKIMSDFPATVTKEGEQLAPQYYGGNNLIIAARNDDWIKIKKLIEELDKPQPQIVLEVLVADLTADDTRMLGTFLRNPIDIPLTHDLEFQSAQFNGALTDNPVTPNTIALYPPNPANDADVLNPNSFTPGGSPVPIGGATPSTSLAGLNDYTPGTNPAGTGLPGAALLSLADPVTNKTWALLQIFKSLNFRKVISNPHIVAVHNQPAKITIGETRLVPDATTAGAAGAGTVINYKWIPATLTITITPRISISETNMADDKVQMTITVTIEDFETTAVANADRFTRSVQTTALLRNQEILPLGGLLELDATDNMNGVPILGRIPIIGYLFKRRFADAEKTNLTVFLCPTIVRPRFHWGADQITRDYIKLEKNYAQEGALFETLKDPITRWFFTDEINTTDVINDFTRQDELKRDGAETPERQKTAHNSRFRHIGENFVLPKDIPDILPQDKILTADAKKPQDQEKSLKELLAKEDNPFAQA